ncbi:hypothetical protein LIER_07552 [Lithospermum erythrorhizon]|uniref:Uncharacterized protein n=1 Tax=Lithospermum erythrorhizon TaxID=34254 RepID=A0AAV3PAB7_LITER
MYNPSSNPPVTWGTYLCYLVLAYYFTLLILLTPFPSFISANVWGAVQNAADPTKVDVAAMKGRRLPLFSSQLVIRKPLVPGSKPIPVFPVKRGSNSEASASVSKCAKLEALANISALSLAPTTSPTEVVSLDDEFTISTQGAVELKKKKYVPAVVFIHPPKAIIPLLTKFGTSAKKGKGKSVSAQGEGSSLDCYPTRYMKPPYSLPNGLPIEEGIFGITALRPFTWFIPSFPMDEGRKHPSSDPLDAFALSAFYMIKALNAQYAATCREAMRELSSEKTRTKLETAKV